MKAAGRRCDFCGRGYLRADRVRLWIVRNPGHRAGWRKVDLRICHNCDMADEAKQVALMLAPSPREGRRLLHRVGR